MEKEEKDRALNLLQNGLLPQVHGAYHDALEMLIEVLRMKPCKDAISRQAVLDEIETVYLSRYWSGFRVDYGGNGTRDYIINCIKQLPPVQPTLNCKNCVFRMGYGTGIDEGILNAIPKKPEEGE